MCFIFIFCIDFWWYIKLSELNRWNLSLPTSLLSSGRLGGGGGFLPCPPPSWVHIWGFRLLSLSQRKARDAEAQLPVSIFSSAVPSPLAAHIWSWSHRVRHTSAALIRGTCSCSMVFCSHVCTWLYIYCEDFCTLLGEKWTSCFCKTYRWNVACLEYNESGWPSVFVFVPQTLRGNWSLPHSCW